MEAEERGGQQFPPDGFVDYDNRAHSGGIEFLQEYIQELMVFLGVDNNEDTESMPSDIEDEEQQEQVVVQEPE